MAIRYGTSYFVSQEMAERYYLHVDAHDDRIEAKRIVQRKLSEGLIHIGLPPVPAGAKLYITDHGSRYTIEEA